VVVEADRLPEMDGLFGGLVLAQFLDGCELGVGVEDVRVVLAHFLGAIEVRHLRVGHVRGLDGRT
jgi:hypothetical protein